MNNERKVPQCQHCGSHNVAIDTTSTWDANAGEWVTYSVLDDDPLCADCGEETPLVWVPAPTPVQPDTPKLLHLCTIEEDATYRPIASLRPGTLWPRAHSVLVLGSLALHARTQRAGQSFAVIESDEIPPRGEFPSTTKCLGPDEVPWAWE